jgi:hypothetical protein|tara:strand:- start:639 stop:902 length:264 start_codon:yes stop_codon:yes gene_type:complete
MPFEIDETARRLHELVLTGLFDGDMMNAELARTMYELYLTGRIDVTFSAEGAPTATLIEGAPAISSMPWFTSPHKDTTERKIGFQLN